MQVKTTLDVSSFAKLLAVLNGVPLDAWEVQDWTRMRTVVRNMTVNFVAQPTSMEMPGNVISIEIGGLSVYERGYYVLYGRHKQLKMLFDRIQAYHKQKQAEAARVAVNAM